MFLLACPDCAGVDFTENFECRRCLALRSLGKAPSLSPQFLTLAKKSSPSSSPQKTFLSRRAKIFLSVGCCFVLCVLTLTISALQTASGKTLKNISEKLIAQNNVNRFSVETDKDQDLTIITLTQENVELANDSKKSLRIKLLLDCAVEGESLNKTPDEYRISILSNNAQSQSLQFGKLKFQVDDEEFQLDKQNWENWENSDETLEYVSYRISRQDLVKIVNASKISFEISEFKGRLNFAQQQSIKDLLTAVSVN